MTTTPSSPNLRRKLLDTARAMARSGLNQGTAGNVSVRLKDGQGFLITPSAVPYEHCQEEDVVQVNWDGRAFSGNGKKPSSEWRMHLAVYQKQDRAQAVLHAHAPCCTSLACLEYSIPAFHYMVAIAGGDSIPCAPYALFGSQQLSDVAVAALHDRRAALLAHHGMICFGDDLDHAFSLALEVEDLARIYLQCLQVTEPPLLSKEHMAEVLAQFAGYRP